MRLRSVIEHVKAQNWTAVGIDFFIVVAGVFLGVQVDNWWRGRADARKEQAYLLELKQDFSQIIDELEDDSRAYERIAVAMVTLLEESRRPAPSLPVADLNRNASQLLYMIGTPIVSDTYANLTGSGDLALLHSQELKNALASFYSYSGLIQLVSNTHEMQLVNVFQPYIIENLDYIAVMEQERKVMLRTDIKASLPAAFDEDRILKELRTPEFRNVLVVKWDISTDLLDVLSTAIERAHKVDALLDAELEQQ